MRGHAHCILTIVCKKQNSELGHFYSNLRTKRARELWFSALERDAEDTSNQGGNSKDFDLEVS